MHANRDWKPIEVISTKTLNLTGCAHRKKGYFIWNILFYKDHIASLISSKLIQVHYPNFFIFKCMVVHINCWLWLLIAVILPVHTSTNGGTCHFCSLHWLCNLVMMRTSRTIWNVKKAIFFCLPNKDGKSIWITAILFLHTLFALKQF